MQARFGWGLGKACCLQFFTWTGSCGHFTSIIAAFGCHCFIEILVCAGQGTGNAAGWDNQVPNSFEANFSFTIIFKVEKHITVLFCGKISLGPYLHLFRLRVWKVLILCFSGGGSCCYFPLVSGPWWYLWGYRWWNMPNIALFQFSTVGDGKGLFRLSRFSSLPFCLVG